MTTEHPTELVLPVALEDLAQSLARLRYDALYVFVRHLAEAVQADALSDGVRGRVRLAAHLDRASMLIGQASNELGEAWKICRPHMEGT